jgi:hypothetical protein
VNLRYLVPALGIIISSSGALFAENVGGLTVGGYVDTVGTFSDTKEDGNGTQKYFSSAIELRVGYKVGDKVTAQIDIEGNNNEASGPHGDMYLEQAYINYAISKEFSLTTGKFTTFAGWVAADSDGLYRINGGPITSLYGTELVGVAGNFAPSEDLGVSVFLVNGLDLFAHDDTTNDATNKRVAIGADVVYKVKDVGSFNLEAGYDSRGVDLTEYEIGVNTTLKFASYEPLTVGAELIFNKSKDSSGAADVDMDKTGFLLMGNHTIPNAPFPMSGTVMFQFVKQSVDAATDVDEDIKEIAIALLTNPTSDAHFGVNAELSYQIESGDTGAFATPTTTTDDDIKSFKFALEAIAVIP